MANIQHAKEPWQHDCLVVAVETIDFAGETLPLCFHMMHREDQQTKSSFTQIAWFTHIETTNHKLTKKELQQAIATIWPPCRLIPVNLRLGKRPLSAFDFARKVFLNVMERGATVVTHDPRRGLAQLLDTVEAFLDIDLPAVSVVSTGVLERARRAGQHANPGESPGAFYARIAGADGDLPDLRRCCQELGLHEDSGQKDHLFHAAATLNIYRHHMEQRLLGVKIAG